jgi:hypothetical protein
VLLNFIYFCKKIKIKNCDVDITAYHPSLPLHLPADSISKTCINKNMIMSNIQTNWYLYQYSALNLTENGKISISTSLTNWYIILGNQQKKQIA